MRYGAALSSQGNLESVVFGIWKGLFSYLDHNKKASCGRKPDVSSGDAQKRGGAVFFCLFGESKTNRLDLALSAFRITKRRQEQPEISHFSDITSNFEWQCSQKAVV